MINEIQQILDKHTDKRISWDEYFTGVLLMISARSSCKRLHVGCILVKDNRIISTGYNGFIGGLEHKSVIRNNHEVATVHAEENAINDAAKRGVSTNNCVAYITHFPCINCTKSLISCGVSCIKYLHDYKNDELATELFTNANIKIDKINI